MAKKLAKPPAGKAEAHAKAEAAAAAARRRGGKKSGSPWNYPLSSLAALVCAVCVTYVLTGKASPPMPAAPGSSSTASTASASSSSRPSSTTAPKSEVPTNLRDVDKNCPSWVEDGECETNPDFMAKTCAKSCDERRRRLGAQGSGSVSSPASGPKAKPGVAPDKNEHCAFWASTGECDNNPRFMQSECATSCSASADELAAQDVHQDCAAWVKDGECYRNPAFMLQQCKASCEAFAKANSDIMQDTSDTCVNFALRGGCESDLQKASTQCRASCHIQRICGNHSETVFCQKALRCEAITDKVKSCAARAAAGECETQPVRMLRECIKSCSEIDLDGMMRFHLPHKRTVLSPLIDLPGSPPRLSGFYSTPPNVPNSALEAKAMCSPTPPGGAAAAAIARARKQREQRQPWGQQHWHAWELAYGRERSPRVPHLFSKVPAEPGSTRMVTVEQVQYSPRIRYLHQLLSKEECEHIIKLAQPLFSRSPVRGSVTRVRTSTTAMLAGSAARDPVVRSIRNRIARFSGYPEPLLEPLQVVRYQQGQKYDGHHDFFDVCDLEDKASNGRRQVTFLIYLVGMPEGESGGGTAFPDLKIEVAPEQGSAVVFNDCFDNGAEDGRSLHAGLPPKNPSSIKMAINGWIRSHSVGHMGY